MLKLLATSIPLKVWEKIIISGPQPITIWTKKAIP